MIRERMPVGSIPVLGDHLRRLSSSRLPLGDDNQVNGRVS
jgi:hypothetical protein